MKKWLRNIFEFLNRRWVSRVVFLIVSFVVLIVVIALVYHSKDNSTYTDTPLVSDADWVPYNSENPLESPTASNNPSNTLEPTSSINPDLGKIDNEPIETPIVAPEVIDKLIPDPSIGSDNTDDKSEATVGELLTPAQKLEIMNFATTNVMNSGLSDAESIILSDTDSRGNTVNIPVFIGRLQSMLELKNGYDKIVLDSGETNEYKQSWSLFSTEATRLIDEAINYLSTEDSGDTPEDWLDTLWEYYDAFVQESNK